MRSYPPDHEYLQPVYWTYRELTWHFRMLRYIVFDLEKDVSIKNMATVKTVWTNLTTWLTEYVQRLSQQHQTDAIKDIFRTWLTLSESRSAIDHDKAILLRLAFVNTFPGYEMLEVMRFKEHVELEVRRERYRDESDLVNVEFCDRTKLEAFSKILDAYMNIPGDQCRWTVYDLFINGERVLDDFKKWAPNIPIQLPAPETKIGSGN